LALPTRSVDMAPPWEYARAAYSTLNWVLVVINNVLWVGIISAWAIINYLTRN
jgi:allantoicase